MPESTLTVGYLVLFTLAALIAAAAVQIHLLRHLTRRRRDRRAAAPRRLLVTFAGEPDAAGAQALVDLPPAQWRLVEPHAVGLLGKLRGEAHEALVSVFERRGVVRRLVGSLRSHSAIERAYAAELLGHLHHRSVAPQLVRLLDDRNPDVAVVAVRALGRLGDPVVVPALLERAATGARLPAHAVTRALSRCGQDATASLVDALTNPDASVRVIALGAIGGLQAVAATPEVCRVLTSDAPVQVRMAAATALGHLQHPSAVDPLLAATGSDVPGPLRVAAASALGDIGARAALPALADLLADPDHRVAHAGGRALRQLGAPGRHRLSAVAAGSDARAAAHAAEALALVDLVGAGRREVAR